MHLSDFTYLERCTIYVYGLFYFFYSIWKSDGFQCLRPKKIFSGELKSILTVLMMLTMTTQAVWDIAMTYVKYVEGYMEVENEAIIKPYQYWTPQNQRLALAANYVEAVAFSLQTSLYFMLQCFWNYLSNSVAKKDFMSSFEFKFYVLWSVATMAMFPVLQWYYHTDPIKEEVIPQFAYAGEVFITAILGIRTFFRFRRIIRHGVETNANPLVMNKLKYFMDINSLMTICLFSYSISFLVMCADGMTEAKVIANNKFAVDCILANINITVLFLYLLFIATFHPRKHYGTSNAVSSADPSSNAKTDDPPPIQSATYSLPTTERSNPRPSAPKRFSQRVTSFIGQRLQHRMVDTAPTDSFQQTFERKEGIPDMMMMHDMGMDENQYRFGNKAFMPPMSPVSVDYPSSTLLTDTAPLTTYQWSAYHVDHHPRIPSFDTARPSTASSRPASPLEHSDWLRRSPDRRNL